MHEATIAQSILEIARLRVAAHDGARVERVRVEIGAFRNVDPEALSFAFDGIKQDYDCCHEARLELRLIEALAVCQKQRHNYSPSAEYGFRCELCNSGIGELLAGEELNVVSCVLSTPVQEG
jgi:hydrogenase nickel incorporation protein HypA/HybF